MAALYGTEDKSCATVLMPLKNKSNSPLIMIGYLVICFKYFIPYNLLCLPPYCHNGGNSSPLKIKNNSTTTKTSFTTNWKHFYN